MASLSSARPEGSDLRSMPLRNAPLGRTPPSNAPFSTALRAIPPAPPGARIGIYGGSFNPPHEGHRHVAQTALTRLQLDSLWWVVSPQNPLKAQGLEHSHAARLAQTRAFVRRHPKMRVTDLETALGAAYTCDLLKALRQRRPGAQFVWIMGGDGLHTLHRWKRWRDILNTLPIAVIARQSPDALSQAPSLATLSRAAQVYTTARAPQGLSPRLVEKAPPRWLYLPARLNPASSTALRGQDAHT